MGETRKKRGRPTDSGALYGRLYIRMNDDVMRELKDACEKHNINQSDLVRIAIRKEIDSMKKNDALSKNDVINYDPDEYWMD